MAGRLSGYRSHGWLANASYLGLSWLAAAASAAPDPLSTTFEVSVGSFIGNPVGEFDSVGVFVTVTFTFPRAEPLTLTAEAVAIRARRPRRRAAGARPGRTCGVGAGARPGT